MRLLDGLLESVRQFGGRHALLMLHGSHTLNLGLRVLLSDVLTAMIHLLIHVCHALEEIRRSVVRPISVLIESLALFLARWRPINDLRLLLLAAVVLGIA